MVNAKKKKNEKKKSENYVMDNYLNLWRGLLMYAYSIHKYSNVWSIENTIYFGKQKEEEKNTPSKRLVDLPTFTEMNRYSIFFIFVLSS